MKNFVEKNITFTFKCGCGSSDFYRPSCFKGLKGFYEGHFKCSNINCDKEHDYTSNAFKRHFTQTRLF